LRPGLVADREEEEDEEHPLERGGHLDPKLPDGHARDQHGDDGIQLDGAKPQLGEGVTQREGQEERDFRVRAESLDQPSHAANLFRFLRRVRREPGRRSTGERHGGRCRVRPSVLRAGVRSPPSSRRCKCLPIAC
jgi:hypothetical protein